MRLTSKEIQMLLFFSRHIAKFKKQIVFLLFLVISTSALNLFLPWADKELLDKGLLKGNFSVIVLYLGILFIARFLYDFLTTGQNYLSTYVTNRFVYNISRFTFSQLLRFPLSFFQRYNLGEITARITGDISSIGILVDTQIIGILTDLCILFGTVFIMLRINRHMFFIACLAIPVLVVMNQLIVTQQKKASRTMRSEFDQKNKCVQEMVLGIQEVKNLNIFKWAERQFNRAQAQIFRAQMRITKLVSAIFLVGNRLQDLIQTGVYLYGAYVLSRGNITVGELFAFLTYFNQSVSILERIIGFNRNLHSSLVSMERVYDILKEGEREVVSTPGTMVEELEEMKVAFHHVSFTYDDQWVIHDLSFGIRPGEKVAICGKNGSGKSTIFKLLTDLLEPQEGIITINGKDISQLSPAELSRSVSFVMQKPFLFHCSIRDNLKLARHHVTDEELMNVIQAVGLKEFVDGLPQGLDTSLTLQGTNLSGGQLQRLAIARSLLKRNDILLLDEPTSSMEEQFEDELLADLVQNYPDLTILMIVHKKRILHLFDRVLYLDSRGFFETENSLATKHSI